jgi:hypothetical protein
MIGKSALGDLPYSKDRAMEPRQQVNMDLFSSAVQLVEGCNYAFVLVNYTAGNRWICLMILKSY